MNLKDRISRAEREKTKIQYMELQKIKNQQQIILIQELLGIRTMQSLLCRIRTNLTVIPRALLRKLNALRQSMSDSLFAANYELKHMRIKTLCSKPKFIDDEYLIYNGLAHIDAAYDGEDGTAYTVFKRLSDGRIVGFGKRWNKHVDDCLQEISVLHKRFRAGSIACEKNADKGYLAKELRELGYAVDIYSESTNKFVKISTYLRSAWKDIFWLESTDPEYINEILDYSEFAEHDDSPDSAARAFLESLSRGRNTIP